MVLLDRQDPPDPPDCQDHKASSDREALTVPPELVGNKDYQERRDHREFQVYLDSEG